MLIPVGVAWERCLGERGCPPLFDADGSHPSAAGSFLAACVFAAACSAAIRLMLRPRPQRWTNARQASSRASLDRSRRRRRQDRHRRMRRHARPRCNRPYFLPRRFRKSCGASCGKVAVRSRPGTFSKFIPVFSGKRFRHYFTRKFLESGRETLPYANGFTGVACGAGKSCHSE